MLSTELKACIQGAYSRFLTAKKLKPRYGQRLMIAEVAKVLGNIPVDKEAIRVGDPAVVAVEAGTGTGKTVAYCLAAIPIAQATDKRLVISTATIALQEQVVNKDLPDLLHNAGLKFSFALAKGRGRYLCISQLDNLLQEGHGQQQTAQLFAEEGFQLDVDEASIKLFTQMLKQLTCGHWDGDRDSWPEALEDSLWSHLTIDHSRCTNRHCPNFQQCSFFKAREALGKVDVVVTNHDMVLADLALGGGVVLPNPQETLYVFDEGHHLPDKAIGHFSHFTRLRSTTDWLGQMVKQLQRLQASQVFRGELGQLLEQSIPLLQSLKEQQQLMFGLCESQLSLQQTEQAEGRERLWYRFPGGIIPDPLREAGQGLQQGFAQLTNLLTRQTERLKQAMDGEASVGLASHQAEEFYPLFGSMLSRAEANRGLWDCFIAEDAEGAVPSARWLTLVEGLNQLDIEVNASPILAAETLKRQLWQQAHGALVTSATLTALNRFDRFRLRAGLPAQAVTTVVPSPFRYAEMGLLQVPDLGVDPKDSAAHTAAIVQYLPGLLEKTLGALVLFSSRRQLQDVFAGLDPDWRGRILLQGTLPKQETLRRHRQQVDAGEPSIVFGLASFAEGVDLPGAYCEHVVIAKLPFAVPDNPVEAALAEWIEARGGNPFMEVAVPDAALRLVQACGRLLRTETDTGVITLLDRRLLTRRYGQAILEALPPFRRLLG